MFDFYKTPGVPGGPKHYSEVLEATECLSCLKIFWYDFSKTPGVPGVPKTFFWNCRSNRVSIMLENIYNISKTPGLSGGCKHYSEVVEVSEFLLSLLTFLYSF